MSLTAYGYGCLRRRAVYAGTRSQGTLFYISVVLLPGLHGTCQQHIGMEEPDVAKGWT